MWTVKNLLFAHLLQQMGTFESQVRNKIDNFMHCSMQSNFHYYCYRYFRLPVNIAGAKEGEEGGDDLDDVPDGV